MKISRREMFAAAQVIALGTCAPIAQTAAATATDAAPNPHSGESLALATYVARTRFEDLPSDVVMATKRALLDAIGVSLAASGLEPACKPFLEFVAEAAGSNESSVLGTGTRAPATLAALANGSLAHAMDYEDAHEETRTHPNAAAIAAALPLAEKLGASGRDLITAVALGCDIVCRLARALVQEGPPPPGFYQPAIVGTFGATTAAAKLLGLNAQQTLDAWSLSLCQNSCSAELQDSPQSQIRAVREGPCARVGVESAMLAAKGVKGFEAPFEGRSGFFVMYAHGVQRPNVLLKDLGVRFAGRDVSFKAWPSCRDTHLYVQTALELLERTPLDPTQIESIVATVAPQAMIVCEPADLKRRPQTAIAAKFSLYFTLAAALIDRRVTFETYAAEALTRPNILALAAKVTYRINPAIAKSDGASIDAIEIRMRDGTIHRHHVRALLGSPAAPLSTELLVKKFLDCGRRAARAQSEAKLQEFAETMLKIDQINDMRPVLRNI